MFTAARRSRNLWVNTFSPTGRAAWQSPKASWTVQPLALKEFPTGRLKSYFIWALGEDDDGELYVLVNGINSVAHTRGKAFKLVPEQEPL